MQTLFQYQIETPIGDMIAISSETGLYQLEFLDTMDASFLSSQMEVNIKDEKKDLHQRIEIELANYFDGFLKEFTIPLKMLGTSFQIRVWNALLDVEYGETRSYKEQSIALGDVKAIRAVGTANGANKIAIIVPCHRIIGSDGKLTGYAGGLDRKKSLLQLEIANSTQFDLFS